MTPAEQLALAAGNVDQATAHRNRLAAQLLADGATSRALAARCGVSHQTIRNWAAAAQR